MEREQKKRIIEALLLAIDEPLTVVRLQKVINDINKEEFEELVEELNVSYVNHSFEIRFVAGGYRFFTKPQYYKWVKALLKQTKANRLSPQALETLAIVAYKQPVTRATITSIRGVDSTGTIQNLVEKELITIAGRSELPGRPILYKTTDYFLECFGMGSLLDLPKIEELEEILKSKEDEHHKRLKLGSYLFEKLNKRTVVGQ